MPALIFILCVLAAIAHSQTLFVSFHKSEPNIYRYPVRNVEDSSPLFTSTAGMKDLRGMVQVGSAIFVANAKGGSAGDGNVLITQDCGKSHTVFASNGFSHPYGIAYSVANSTFYVTNQNADNVIMFNALQPNSPLTFAAVGSPRGIAVDPKTRRVLVASEKSQSVEIFSASGTKQQTLSLGYEPIGVYINGRTLYVASKTSGAESYNLDTLARLNVYSHSTLGHGTGMAVYNEVFYILGQDTGVLCSFIEHTGQYLGTLVTSFPDTVEQLLIGNC